MFNFIAIPKTAGLPNGNLGFREQGLIEILPDGSPNLSEFPQHGGVVS
jgi:hypothetical protein